MNKRYAFLCLFFPALTAAETVVLSWDAPTTLVNSDTAYDCTTPLGGLPQADQDNITAGECLDGYVVYWSDGDQSFGNQEVISDQALTTVSYEMVAPQGTVRNFVIRAVDGNGVESASSNVISYTFTEPSNTIAPTVMPADGASLGTITVTATAPAGLIRYTDDGSIPDASSPVYTGALAVNSSVTLQFVADDGGFLSQRVSRSYTLPPFTTGPTFSNAPFGWQDLQITATPTAGDVNAVMALAPAAVSFFDDWAVAVRFADTGVIEARSLDGYAADVVVPYTAGTEYTVQIDDINFGNKTYDAYVTPSGGSRVKIAENYQFDSNQQLATELNYFAHWSSTENALTLAEFSPVSVASAPEINVVGYSSGSTYSLGTVTAGDENPTLTLTFQNTGTSPLTLQDCAVTGDQQISITSQPASPVAGGADTTVVISGNASVAGNYSGTVSCPNNDTDEDPFNLTFTLSVAATAVGVSSDSYSSDDFEPPCPDGTVVGLGEACP